MKEISTFPDASPHVAIFCCLAILFFGCNRPLEVPMRPVKVAEVDAMGDVSPDGRYLTYVDWSSI